MGRDLLLDLAYPGTGRAQRQPEDHYTDQDCDYPGGLFVDEYTEEYSRDCEPMRGGHSDNYYYQLAAWVRRFKGVRPLPKAKGPSPIRIDGSFEDWKPVTPEFRDTMGDTIHRHHAGYGDLVYDNDTGRNDLVILKAAYDRTHLYLFAQTLKPISSGLAKERSKQSQRPERNDEEEAESSYFANGSWVQD